MNALIAILTFVLILVSVFLVLVVLAQKAKSDGGMGAAMGGGMAESAFGAETGNVLSKATINAAIVFFVLSFALYLGHVYQHKHAYRSGGSLPVISSPASTTPLSLPSLSSSPSVALPTPSASIPAAPTNATKAP